MFTISSRQIVGIYISKKCTNNDKFQQKIRKLRKFRTFRNFRKFRNYNSENLENSEIYI